MKNKLVLPIIDSKTKESTRLHFREQPYKQKKKQALIPNLKRDLKHGWLLTILAQIDRCLWGRWDYWALCQAVPSHTWMRWQMEPMLAILENRKPEKLPKFVIEETLPAEPIPQIEWQHSPAAEAMLDNTLNCIPQHGEWKTRSAWEYLDFFLNWVLFAFGHPAYKILPKEPAGCEGASMRLYQMFDLSILMLYPEDYMGRLLPQICGKTAQKSSGFYPTPLALGQFMSKLVSGDKIERVSNFNEPACGTGALMLAQSNYCLSGIGQDVEPILLKCALFQFYLFSPWLAIPIWWLGQTDLLLGNSLSSDRPQSMNAACWYNEWFEPVESQAKNPTDRLNEDEISSEESSAVIDLDDLTSIHSNPVVQEVVKGKRRPRKTTRSPHQFSLFNLDDF
ncbi:hypothetical protein QUA30_21400 [Microcoleus sp. Pol14C2]|uniref:hypothetical protein n=1 Tax=unclassified Microcoleus TaxID=2642155 RepID=UPI002FD5899F